MIKLAISGYQGKMGKRILAFAGEDAAFKITAKIEMNDPVENAKGSDVLIEFTTPEATIAHLKACSDNKRRTVVAGKTHRQKNPHSLFTQHVCGRKLFV